MISAGGKKEDKIYPRFIFKKKAKDTTKTRGDDPNYDPFVDDDSDDYVPTTTYKETPIIVKPPLPITLKREKEEEEEEEAEEEEVKKPKGVFFKARRNDAMMRIDNPHANENFIMSFQDLFYEIIQRNDIEPGVEDEDPIIVLVQLYESFNPDTPIYFPLSKKIPRYPMEKDILRNYISRWITYEIEGFQIQFDRLIEELDQKGIEPPKNIYHTPERFLIIVNDYREYLQNVPELLKLGQKWMTYKNIRNEQGF
jgi:hypothetical protein